ARQRANTKASPLATTRLSDPQAVAGLERAAFEPAEAAAQKRRAAAEHGRNVDPARDRDDRPRAVEAAADRERRAGRDRERFAVRNGTAVELALESGSRDRDERPLVEADLGTGERDLDRGALVRIADESVRDAERKLVHRAAR